MSSEQPAALTLDSLSTQELRAMAEAATWYAKYHEQIIAEQADDQSALAVSTREHFADLYRALSKLGVRLRKPAGLEAA